MNATLQLPQRDIANAHHRPQSTDSTVVPRAARIQQVSGVNALLSAVYDTEMRISTLLQQRGFTTQQIDLLRTTHLDPFIDAITSLLHTQMRAGHDGERRAALVSRRFGLDGSPPQTLDALGQQWDVSCERVNQLVATTLKRWRLPRRRQQLERALCDLSVGLVGLPGEDPPTSPPLLQLSIATTVTAPPPVALPVDYIQLHQALLECVSELPGQFTRTSLARLLCGSTAQGIAAFRERPSFGTYRHLSRRDIVQHIDYLLVTRQLLQQGTTLWTTTDDAML